MLMLLLLASGISHAIGYGAALKKAGKKPVILFCYGANYDKLSEARYQDLIKDRALSKVARGLDVVEIPVYQFPDEKQKKEQQKALDGRPMPSGIWSYPCLAIVDSKGNLRGVVQSAQEMQSAQNAVAALSNLLAQYYEQEKVLEKASKATGARRRALLAEAGNFDLKLPAGAAKSDETAAEIESLAFDPLDLVEKIQTMSIERAYNHIRELENSGGRSRYQRQEMLAALSGHIRRNKGSEELLKAIYIEMRNIDPNSSYAAYAEGALELWCGMGEEEKDKEKQ